MILAAVVLSAVALAEQAAPTEAAIPKTAAELQKMTARFAPVELNVNLSKLPPNEQQALAKLVEAAKVMDALYLRQVWGGNPSLLIDLLRDTTPLGKARLRAFLINKGPWSRLDDNAPFIAGVPPKPHQANYYPAGATKAEVEKFINALPPDQKAAATGFFTTIRRGPDGKFVLVPYAVEYQGELAEVAKRLRDAAQLTAQPTLKAFLNKRADALLSNDYYASDVAWMELDSSIEPTIGPYEVYG